MKKKARTGLIIAGTTVGAVLLTGSAIAISQLAVEIPLLPAVGQANADACDTDGVSTTFTYGNTSANGVKVTSAKISSIAAACTKATVEFVKADAVIDTYNSAVSSGTANFTTNIFTNQFDSVRVLLSP